MADRIGDTTRKPTPPPEDVFQNWISDHLDESKATAPKKKLASLTTRHGDEGPSSSTDAAHRHEHGGPSALAVASMLDGFVLLDSRKVEEAKTSEEIAKSIKGGAKPTDLELAQLVKKFKDANEIAAPQLGKDGGGDAAARATDRAQSPHFRSTTTNPIDQSRFAEVAKEVLAKIDTQHTGHVTKEQLAKAMQDPSFKGEQAQVLAAMYYQFDKLRNLSKDSPGITGAGLDRFQQMQREQRQKVDDAFEMKDWAQKNLAKYAPDGKNLLLHDIQNALHNPQLSPEDRHALELIEKNYNQMAHRPSFTGLNVSDFDNNINHLDPEAKLVAYVAHACSRVANEAQKAGMCLDLYATANPLDSIKPGDSRQGEINSCPFVASLAAVAQACPELIRDAITDNHDGTYTVRFPGAKSEAITVKAPTEAEMGLYSADSKDGIWAAVMLKAYGQYRINHGYPGSVPTEGADGGGEAFYMLKLLTGDFAPGGGFVQDNAQGTANMAKLLQDAFSRHPPLAVTATTRLSPVLNKTPDGFQNYHVYTIQGFIPDGKGGGTVVVRNPKGGQDGTPEGTIQIPLSVFMRNFNEVTTAEIILPDPTIKKTFSP